MGFRVGGERSDIEAAHGHVILHGHAPMAYERHSRALRLKRSSRTCPNPLKPT
jgi:hypothetical protein